MARLLAMFSSAFDGEIVNAARAAERLRQRTGLDWAEILAAPPIAGEPLCELSLDELLDLCAGATTMLTPWERRFIRNIRRQNWASLKQRAILDQIVERLRGSRQAAA